MLPWRPAILSPTEIGRFCAIQTCTFVLTPADNSSPVKTLTLTTLPHSPCGTLREVSFTSLAFSPKMARNSFSSADNSVSPLGVILPTRISSGPTLAPTRIIPCSSSSRRLSSPTFGISRVISSGPSLVSLASTSYFSICIEVKESLSTRRLLRIIASS